MFKVMRSGKRQKKQWKRMLTKVTFVGGAFTRKPPKYERFIRPTGAFFQPTEAALSCCDIPHASFPSAKVVAAHDAHSASTQHGIRQVLSRGMTPAPSELRVGRAPSRRHRFHRPVTDADACGALTGLRMKKAHVTHPELKCTFCLEIIGVKKNPNGQTYTALGVITKGTVIEVNVSELGLVTPGGKVVWGKYAQVRPSVPFHSLHRELAVSMLIQWAR